MTIVVDHGARRIQFRPPRWRWSQTLAVPLMDVPPDDEYLAQLVRDCYDQIAESYMAQVTRPGPAPRHVWVDRFCRRLTPGSAILDLGCGPGVPTTAVLVAEGHAVTGLDLSPRQIALASRNVPSADFSVGDVLSANFDDSSVDGVVMLHVITHVPRDRHAEVLTRMRGWLRPRGWLLINFGTNDSPAWLEENFLGHGVQSWTNSWEPERSLSLLADAGFRVAAADVVATREPEGDEQWLWVLAQRARLPA